MKDIPKKYLFYQQFVFLRPSEELLLYVDGPQSRPFILIYYFVYVVSCNALIHLNYHLFIAV